MGGSHSYGGHYDRGGHYGRSGIDVTVVEPPPYYYYDDYGYPPDYTAVAPAPVVQVVESAQQGAEESAGPVQINSYQPATADTVIIGVPNSKGGFISDEDSQDAQTGISARRANSMPDIRPSSNLRCCTEADQSIVSMLDL